MGGGPLDIAEDAEVRTLARCNPLQCCNQCVWEGHVVGGSCGSSTSHAWQVASARPVQLWCCNKCVWEVHWMIEWARTLTCKNKVSNSILIQKFQNNPKQCAHPKTWNFRNVFDYFKPFWIVFRSVSIGFAAFFASFRRRRRRDVVCGVVVDRSIDQKNFKQIFKRFLIQLLG